MIPEQPIMKRLILSLAFVLVAAGTPAFAQQSGGVRASSSRDLAATVSAPMDASVPCMPPPVPSS